jgi:hypothetical protein
MSLILGILDSGGAAAGGGTSYESIATVTVGSGGSSTISFTSIPATYTHLQIRGIGRTTTAAAGGANFGVRFNSDTSSNYTYHLLSGNGSATNAAGGGNTNQVYFADLISRDGNTASVYSDFVIDILDYLNTNKFKTVRGLAGWDSNGSGQIGLSSGVWRNTNAITAITLVPDDNFKQYTSFALYGIKGA